MRTGTIDLEISAGDQNFLPLSAGKTPDLILKSNRTLISDWSGARATFNVDSTMLREKVAIGYSSLPTFDFISGATSSLDTISHARVRGNLLIGDLSGTTSSALIGYGRTVDGAAKVNLYTNGLTPTFETFDIFRASGQNGVGRISQYGSGLFEFNHVGTGDIKFSTTGVGIERMRITSGGKVGIGNPTPTTTLDVNGAIRTIGSAGLPVTTGTGPILTGSISMPNIGKLYIGDGGGWKFHFSRRISSTDTDLVTIVDTGFVGIGETNPSDKLDVKDGNISINDSSLAVQGIGRGIKFENGNPAFSSINLYRGSTPTNVGLSFVNSNSGATAEAMRIHPNGFVSIGPSAHLNTPTYRVHIQDNSAHSLLIRSNNTGSGSRNNILFQKQNGAGVTSPTSFIGGLSFGGWDGTNWSVGYDGGAEILAGVPFSWSFTSKPAFLTFNTTPNGSAISVERMRIMDSGFVGIGTSTPISKLEVNGDDISIVKGSFVSNTIANGIEFIGDKGLGGYGTSSIKGYQGAINGTIGISLSTANSGTTLERIRLQSEFQLLNFTDIIFGEPTNISTIPATINVLNDGVNNNGLNISVNGNSCFRIGWADIRVDKPLLFAGSPSAAVGSIAPNFLAFVQMAGAGIFLKRWASPIGQSMLFKGEFGSEIMEVRNDRLYVNSKVESQGGYEVATTIAFSVPHGSGVTYNHNLGYIPIANIQCQDGNVNPNITLLSTTQIRIYNFNSGGNTALGTIYLW